LVLLGVVLAEDERILAELVKIREALTAAPAPPPEPMGLWMEFIDFINKYGVVGLAIGFIIGSASRDLVNALVADILMPVITFFIPGGTWKEATLTVGPVVLSIGHFVGALIDYLIIALIVFYLMKTLKRTSLK
jgi:large conductance mechanosensitive channel